MKTKGDVLGSGRERVRTGPWRADGHVAFLAPAPDSDTLSATFVVRCLEELAGRGFLSVITSALEAPQRHAFVTVGFEEQERLLLLTHDLDGLPPRTSTPLRRAWRADWGPVLGIDTATFANFWRLDSVGLDQAIRATTSARFRVALDSRGGGVVGYAITGKDRRHGYMQRLAVLREHQRGGRGRALVLDGLHWLRRRGADQALVNTQVGNAAAFSLYRRLGFRLESSDLVVLRRDLTR